MEFWEEWLLIEGFIKQQEEAQNYSGDYYQDDDYDPRYPRKTDRMATGAELMMMGAQYTQE